MVWGAAAEGLAEGYGLARSLWTYRRPGRVRRLTRLYAPFVKPGDLCFDIGAHVGDRSACFLRLGARVVAVEPQPRFAAYLRWGFRAAPAVTVVEAAVAGRPGRIEMFTSRRHPTVSTGSKDFLDAVADVPSFKPVRWDGRHVVEATTLDALIGRFGEPTFVKIDVEGMEDAVLLGLDRPVRALSFEFVPAHRDAALRAVDRLATLGRYRFRAAYGETGRFVGGWGDAATLKAWLEDQAADGPSGDVYAALTPPA